MNAYPKHYLAEVPQEIRLKVLDLCMRRYWHDALELLHQNGFTQYEWWEVVWFHDYAPTNLEPEACAVPSAPSDRSADSLSALECGLPRANASTPLSHSPSPEPGTLNPELTESLNPPASSVQEPASAPLTLTPDAPCSSVRSVPSVLKSGRRRSKVCRLPADIQLSLNTMLSRGCRYRDIIHNLNTRGYPGFNKVNLNTWKRTGFQDWLRSQPSPVTDQPSLVTVSNPSKVIVTDSNRQ